MSKASYLRVGLKAAKKNPCNFQLCAMIIRGGRIVGMGCNRDKTDPFFTKNPKLNRALRPGKKVDKLHAESCAINSTPPELLKGSDMVVVRASKKMGVGCARPCPQCFQQLREAGIRKVYYTLDYGNMVCENVATGKAALV